MIESLITVKRPSSVPRVALSAVHFMLWLSGLGGSMSAACTNSVGGEPSTLSVPDSSQHSGRCAISVRPTVSSGSPSARHSVPVEVHTAGSNRNVCAMGPLWRAAVNRGTLPRNDTRQGFEHADGTHLVREQLPEFPLPHRLPRDR